MANTGKIRAGAAFVEIFADTSPLVRGLRSAETKIRAMGASVKTSGLWIAAAGMAITAPLLKAAKTAGDMGHELSEMSKRTGVSVEKLSALGYAANQSGIDIETLNNGIKFMHKNLYAAAGGAKSLNEALAAIGVSVKDFENMSPDEKLLKISDAFNNINDPTAKAALAMKLFGRNGVAMLPFLIQGSTRIIELMNEATKLGLVLSAKDVASAAGFHHELKKLWDVVKLGTFRIGSALIPVLKTWAKTLMQAIQVVGEFIRQHQGIITAALYVGIALVAAGTSMVVFGTVLTSISKIIGLVRIGLMTLGAAMSLAFSPLGLAAGAIATLVGLSVEWGAVIDWLKEKFQTLKMEMKNSIDGIAAALQSGNVALAAKIFWLTIKTEWQKATLPLLEIWENLYAKIAAFWSGGSFADSIQYALNVAWAHIKKWGEQVFVLLKGIATLGIQGLIKKAATKEAIALKAQQLMERETGEKPPAQLNGGLMTVSELDSETEYNKRLAAYMERAKKEVEQIATDENMAAMFPGGNTSFQDILNKAAGVKEESVPMPQSLQDAGTQAQKEAAEKIRIANEELAKAIKERDAAIHTAKNTQMRNPNFNFDPFEFTRNFPDNDFAQTAASFQQANSKSFGTFSAFGLGQIGSQNPMLAELVKIAKGVQQVANNTEDNGEDD